jgi:hypothetical protein
MVSICIKIPSRKIRRRPVPNNLLYIGYNYKESFGEIYVTDLKTTYQTSLFRNRVCGRANDENVSIPQNIDFFTITRVTPILAVITSNRGVGVHIPIWARFFLLSKSFRPVLGFAQLYMKQVPGGLFPQN